MILQKVLWVAVCAAICGTVSKGNASEKIVVLETSQGKIEIRLMPEVAPLACENFEGLVKKGYYNGIIFHRVIKGFMIQGGDPLGTGTGGSSLWGKPFKDECSASVKFDTPGLLAMANAGPGTNGSQFFITTSTPHWLHMRHTIFGKVISGYNIVQKIEGTKTASGDRPVIPQKIIKAYMKPAAK
jgi:peptidylprolyl isomerase